MSPIKHKLKEPGRKHVSASETARLKEEAIFYKSKSNVRKLESDEEESDFECYDKSDGKPVYVGDDKEIAINKPTLALIQNRW